MSVRLNLLKKLIKNKKLDYDIIWNPNLGYLLNDKKIGRSFEEAYNFILKIEKNNEK